MQADLDTHFPSSDVEILAINEIGHESANDLAAAESDLPLLQDIDSNSDNLSDTWEEWNAEWRDVRIVDADGEQQGNYNLRTEGDLREQADYDLLRGMIVDAATANRVAESRWQNVREPLDIDNNGFIAPTDVLTIVNGLNEGKGGDLSATAAVDSYFDPSGNNILSPLDALLVVRHLNQVNSVVAAAAPADTGSGEPAGDNGADAFFASLAQSQNDDDDAGEK